MSNAGTSVLQQPLYPWWQECSGFIAILWICCYRCDLLEKMLCKTWLCIHMFLIQWASHFFSLSYRIINCKMGKLHRYLYRTDDTWEINVVYFRICPLERKYRNSSPYEGATFWSAHCKLSSSYIEIHPKHLTSRIPVFSDHHECPVPKLRWTHLCLSTLSECTE